MTNDDLVPRAQGLCGHLRTGPRYGRRQNTAYNQSRNRRVYRKTPPVPCRRSEAQYITDALFNAAQFGDGQETEPPTESSLVQGMNVCTVYVRLSIFCEARIRANRYVRRIRPLSAGDQHNRQSTERTCNLVDSENDCRVITNGVRKRAAPDLTPQWRDTAHHGSASARASSSAEAGTTPSGRGAMPPA